MPPKAKKTVLYSSEPESESENEEIPPKSELTESIVAPVNLPKVEPLGKSDELTFEAGLEIGKGKKAKRGRPPVTEGATAVVKPEKKPLPCSYCGKEYQTLFNLQRHLNDNRCPIKNDQDKKAFEKQQAMALEVLSKSKKAKPIITHKGTTEEEQVEMTPVKKPRKPPVSPKDGTSQKKEVQELPEPPKQPQQFTAPSVPPKPRVTLRFG